MSPSMADPIKVATGASVATPRKPQLPIPAGDGATSTKTDTSGDTLHDDESSDVRSSSNSLPTPSSPISPASLNFGSLAITGGGVELRKNSVDRYNNPFERMQKQHNESSTYRSPVRDFRGNRQLDAPYGVRGGGFRPHRPAEPDAGRLHLSPAELRQPGRASRHRRGRARGTGSCDEAPTRRSPTRRSSVITLPTRKRC